MQPLTVILWEDVAGTPKALFSHIPYPLKVGDPLNLRCRLSRENGGRSEDLLVNGQFRVTAVGVDASLAPARQLLTVVSLGRPPTWRAVKKASQRRRLAPTIWGRTSVG